MPRLIADIRRDIADHPARCTWDKGVRTYALELLDDFADGKHLPETAEVETISEKDLLNGATDWSQFSYGGCSLVYDGDICERLCTPSQIKKTRGGEWHLSSGETWLDVQARALRQASRLVTRIANRRV